MAKEGRKFGGGSENLCLLSMNEDQMGQFSGLISAAARVIELKIFL